MSDVLTRLVARARRSDLCLGRRPKFRFAPSSNPLGFESSMADDPLANALRVQQAAEPAFAEPAASARSEPAPASFGADASPRAADSQADLAAHAIDPASSQSPTPPEVSAPRPAEPATETPIKSPDAAARTEDGAARPSLFAEQEPLETSPRPLHGSAENRGAKSKPVSTDAAPTSRAPLPAVSIATQPSSPVTATAPEHMTSARGEAGGEPASAGLGAAELTFAAGPHHPSPSQHHVQAVASSPAAQPSRQGEAATAAPSGRQQRGDGEGDSRIPSGETAQLARSVVPPDFATGFPVEVADPSPLPEDSPRMPQSLGGARAEPPRRRGAGGGEAELAMPQAAQLEGRVAGPRVLAAGSGAAARQPQQQTSAAPPALESPQTSRGLSAARIDPALRRASTPAGATASLQPIHIDIGRIQIDLPRRPQRVRSRPQPPALKGKPRGGPDT
jgi:hypothetical protein